MLTIRLQRTGTKNAANFRVVVAEKTAHVSKKVHEVLGSYNPHKKSLALRNPERVNYWIAQKIEISPSVHNLLVEKNLLKADKVKAFSVPKKETPKEEPKAEVSAPAETAPAEVAAEAVAETPTEAPVETPKAE